jgi:hypothetical protein
MNKFSLIQRGPNIEIYKYVLHEVVVLLHKPQFVDADGLIGVVCDLLPNSFIS